MSIRCDYHLDGCEGELRRPVRGELGLEPTGLWFLGALPAALFVAMGLWWGWALIIGGLAAVAIEVGVGADLLVPLQAREMLVVEHFSVSGGVLRLSSSSGEQEVLLAGATVWRFDDGVWVNPALGDPVELRWGAATAVEVEALAVALEGAARAPRPQPGSVPEALSRLRSGQDLS